MVAVLLVFVVCLAVVLVLRVLLENVKFDLDDMPLCKLTVHNGNNNENTTATTMETTTTTTMKTTTTTTMKTTTTTIMKTTKATLKSQRQQQ